jgi:hypothetical protein
MRVVRIVTIVAGVLLGGTLLAAWLVPPMLDWNRYRDSMATLVSGQLGRAVQIEGPVSLSLLPQPILTAGRITVADAGDGVTATVAELRLRLALGPLLRGRVDAQELVIGGPDVRLPWPLDVGRLQGLAPDWLASLQASIEGGRLSLGGIAITGIDATLGTLETGSYAAAGTANVSGQPWHMTARLTRQGADGSAGLDLTMDGQGRMQGLGAVFSGQMAADGGLVGRISGRGPDLSGVLPAPPVGFRADGRLNVAAGLVIADELAVDIAGSPARGAVSLRLGAAPRLDVSLAASRLDLDAWLAALLRGGAAAPVATGIDLSAEAATLAGGTMRALRGRFDIDGATIALRDGEAVLPGEARLTVSGGFTRPSDVLRFDGRAAMDAPSLRTTLAWLDGAGLLDGVPPDVLRQARLQAGVAASFGPRPELSLSALGGTLDGAPVQGGLIFRPGARASLSGSLAFGSFELDPWWPSSWPGLSGVTARFARLDLDLRLSAERLRFLGQDFTQGVLDLAAEPGRLILRRAEASAASFRVVAGGAIQDGGRISDGRFELQAPAMDQALAEAARILPALATVPGLPHWPVALTVTGTGPPEAIAVRATLDAGDLHAEAQPVIDLPGGRWAGPLMLRHPGAPRLLEALGLLGAPSWLGDGSLSLVAVLAGTKQRISAESFDLAAGLLRATGGLALELGAVPRLSGRVSAETLPLPLPYPRSPDPMPLAALSGWQGSVRLEAGRVLGGLSPVINQLSTQLTVKDGVLRLAALSGVVDGGALAGAASFDSTATPPLLSAELAWTGATVSAPLFDLPVDIASATVDATAKLTATGHAPLALLATLSGTARLSARAGRLSGVDLAAAGALLLEADLRRALGGGSFGFDQIEVAATLANGALTLQSADVTSSSGTARLTGLVDIAGETAELRLSLRPAVAQPPEIAVRLSGPWARPSRILEITEAQVWRATHP